MLVSYMCDILIIVLVILFIFLVATNIYIWLRNKTLLSLFISTEDTLQDVMYKLGLVLNEDEDNDNTNDKFVSAKEVSLKTIDELRETNATQIRVLAFLMKLLAIGCILCILINYSLNNYWMNSDTAQEVVTVLYTTSPKDMEDAWSKLKTKIDGTVQYKLDMTRFENLVQRHQGINSKDTKLTFTTNKSKDGTIVLFYEIKSPTQQQVCNRMALIKFNKLGKIIDFTEYSMDSSREVVKYM